jgi:2-C-methyl-D-erythritol 4-phosphate cytidylyltransferase
VGGPTRSESVRNGLEDLPADLGCVLVHDAARPLVPDSVVDAVIRGAREGRVTVPALPVLDTVKQVHAADPSLVRATLPRSELVLVQTPQGFPRDAIIAAHQNALAKGLDATDDAALCEAMGIPVNVVPGSRLAMKITNESDFAVAEALASVPQAP